MLFFKALLLTCLALAGSPAEKVPTPPTFHDKTLGFSLAFPPAWLSRDQLPEDVKKRTQLTASKLSTAQAAQVEALGIYLREPFPPHAQLTSLRIDLIDDPSVASLDPVTLAQAALLNIKKGDPGARLLEAPRLLKVDGHEGSTFSVENASVYVKTLDQSGITRARLWFFPFDGRWLKVNFSTAKEEWDSLAQDLEKLEKGMHFDAPAIPEAKKGADDILDGLKAFK